MNLIQTYKNLIQNFIKTQYKLIGQIMVRIARK